MEILLPYILALARMLMVFAVNAAAIQNMGHIWNDRFMVVIVTDLDSN